MTEMKITICAADGRVKAEKGDGTEIQLVFEGEYEIGDRILLETTETDTYYIIRIDDSMEEAFVYLTAKELSFEIPFDEKKISYNPKAFSGERHYITMRKARPYEVGGYKNLAKNVMDQHGDRGCYPHAWANVETRGEAVFAARNAIDGVLANASHGAWPYESWGINRQDDAAITLEFGRPVDFDTLVLYTRADFPHDNWWEQATLTCSDGTTEILTMEKSCDPHYFTVKRTGITWIRLDQLIKADDPSPFPALTQIEVYGTEQ